MAETIIAGTAVAMDAGPAGAKSAASWPGIIAGAFVAAACTVFLVSLGSGIGFASISPWPDRGASATSFAVTTAIWLIVTQWVSAALGGYIAGRLRTRWIGTHPHEVFFRDTAHGLITWSVATVLVVAVGAGAFRSAAGTAAHVAGAGAVAAVTGSAGGAMPANTPRIPRCPMPIRRFRPMKSTSSSDLRISAAMHCWETRARKRRTSRPTPSSTAASRAPIAATSSSR